LSTTPGSSAFGQYKMNRPQTNHQGKGTAEIIKTSALPINQFSEELIAQLKFSENLIIENDENTFPFQ